MFSSKLYVIYYNSTWSYVLIRHLCACVIMYESRSLLLLVKKLRTMIFERTTPANTLWAKKSKMRCKRILSALVLKHMSLIGWTCRCTNCCSSTMPTSPKRVGRSFSLSAARQRCSKPWPQAIWNCGSWRAVRPKMEKLSPTQSWNLSENLTGEKDGKLKPPCLYGDVVGFRENHFSPIKVEQARSVTWLVSNRFIWSCLWTTLTPLSSI